MTPTQLKAWRKHLGYSQQAAADLLGFSREHYNRLEQGRYKITPQIARLIDLLSQDK